MTIRTTKRTVIFRNPFTLASFGEALPAGDYVVETDEELLDGVSFPVYRRISTLLHLPPKPGHPGRKQALPVDPAELDAALACDQGSDGHCQRKILNT
jgi:hypothetical protein